MLRPLKLELCSYGRPQLCSCVLPVVVLLRPGRKVGELDQRFKNYKAARTRTHLGSPRGRTTVNPSSASDPASLIHSIVYVVLIE